MRWERVRKMIYSRMDLLVLLICLSVVYGGWHWGVRNDVTTQTELNKEKLRIEEKIDEYIETFFQYNESIKGLYAARDEVTADELSLFVKTMMEGDEQPAILRFSIVKAISDPQIDQFEQVFRRENKLTSYRVEKVDGDVDQFLVTRVVDSSGVVYQPSGQNLIVEPKRRELIKRVRESKENGVAWVDQVKNVDEYNGVGFVLSTPLYHKDKLIGLVNLLLRKDVVANEISGWIGDKTSWQWWVSDEGVVQVGDKPARSKQLVQKIRIPLPGGSEWGVDLSMPDVPSVNWNILLGLGIVFSFMIYAIVYALSSAGVRAEELAEKMTVEMSARNEFIEMVLSSLPIGIAVNQISTGKPTYINQSFEHIYGWPKDKLTNVEEFFINVYPDIKVREEMKMRITSDMASGDPKRMQWSNIEITTSTGQKRYVDAHNIPLLDQDLMVSMVQDVTERRLIEDEQAKHSNEIEKLNKLMVGRELKMIELKKSLKSTRSEVLKPKS